MTLEQTQVRVEEVARTASPVRRGRRRRSRSASVGLHAALLTASGIATFPVFWVLVTSFKPDARAVRPTPTLVDHPSLDNYVDILAGRKGAFLTWFANSLIIASLTTVIAVFLAASAGYAVSRFRFPGYRSLMLTLLITQMFPFAVLIVPLYNLLLALGLQGSQIGLVLVYCTTAVPFCTYLMKSYFDSIPYEIDEAGRVDGLSPFGVFWRLILPLAKPALAVTGFYTFLTAWGEVAFASAFLSAADESKTLAVGLQVFVQQNRTEWGHMAAASILVAIPAVIVFYIVQRFLVAGLSAGSVKG